MLKPLKKIIGTKKSDFDKYDKSVKDESIKDEDRIILQPARLITTYKPGDEMALTSIFLSSLRLIKEFKKDFFSKIKMTYSRHIYVYTEVTFPTHKDSRIDGLILVVIGGIIRDAAILEMKNGKNELNKDQIDKYLQICKDLEIPKLVTISNQFVIEPTQSPLDIRAPKKTDMYHFSWSSIRTIAHLLLFKNDNNIEDPDQIEIMKEVLAYFENVISGICGFTEMKPGWKEVVENINAGKILKMNDTCVMDTVSSWQQEEKDMALILTRKLGVHAKPGVSKDNNDAKQLITKKHFTSVLRVKDAVSDITINALFEKRIVEMSVRLNAPQDKGIKGQIGWLKKQFINCDKKNHKVFAELQDKLQIDINIKHKRGLERVSYSKLDEIYETYKGREINGFTIALVKDFGKSFSSRRKFVEVIEKMLLDFYGEIAQNLSNWIKPAPQILKENIAADNETK
jgi:hypothetical protein